MYADRWVMVNGLVGRKKPPPLVVVSSPLATEFAHPLPPIIISFTRQVDGYVAHHYWRHHPPGSLALMIVPFLAYASCVGFLAGKETVSFVATDHVWRRWVVGGRDIFVVWFAPGVVVPARLIVALRRRGDDCQVLVRTA